MTDCDAPDHATSTEPTNLEDGPPVNDDPTDATDPENVAVAEGGGTEASLPTDNPTSKLLRLAIFVVLPLLAVSLAVAAAYFKYQDATAAEADRSRVQSVQTAKEDTVALLTYTPDTVEAKLNAASDRLVGSFRDSYVALIRDTVIPGAKQKQISANATVPAAASVSASRDHAKVMVFVNQTTTVGNDVPTISASVVEVHLDNVGGRWLVSGFEPR